LYKINFDGKEDNYMKKENKTDISKISVKIHIPEKVSEATRQQKINRLYDILKPKKTA